MKLGPVTAWLNQHPFVPFPIALAILLLALGVLVPSSIAVCCSCVEPGFAWCPQSSSPFTNHTGLLVRGHIFASEASYVPGRAERVEWASTGVYVVLLVGGYLAVAGPSPASVGAMLIVIGVGLRQFARGRKGQPRV
jgi:hypothetical protein